MSSTGYRPKTFLYQIRRKLRLTSEKRLKPSYRFGYSVVVFAKRRPFLQITLAGCLARWAGSVVEIGIDLPAQFEMAPVQGFLACVD